MGEGKNEKRKRICCVFANGVSALQIESTYINEIGQNNDVLIVNDDIVFRFPKYEKGIEKLRLETKLLERLQSFITLPIPYPFWGD
ncbi:hypothetical protein [Bacillus sp. AW]|uniref:hypothetical protein n=1 Tax=Bacillus sp. AW TaxID=2293329 RepID=UPI00211D49BC